MKRCTAEEQKTCNVEKLGCEGCYYNKPLAKGDFTYCVKECNEKCSRHRDNYIFSDKILYSFTNECIRGGENK